MEPDLPGKKQPLNGSIINSVYEGNDENVESGDDLLHHWCVVEPTSGPVNISVRPVPSGVGRSRSRTSNVDDDDDDGETGDDADHDGVVAAARTGGRITLNVDWSVREL